MAGQGLRAEEGSAGLGVSEELPVGADTPCVLAFDPGRDTQKSQGYWSGSGPHFSYSVSFALRLILYPT